MQKIFLAIVFLLFLAAFSFGQQLGTVTQEMRQEAAGSFQKSDWANAAKAYEKIAQAEPQNAGAHYRLGVSLHGLGKFKEAAASIEKALAIAPNPVFLLAAAKSYARLGNAGQVFAMLDRANKSGGIQPETLKSDPDFESIKKEARFIELLKEADLAANPCKATPEFRQFDFWIGEWNAKNVQGVTIGSSSIQLILGSCVIFENWSTPVNSGKSFNIFDRNTKKWHQTWVDDKGNFTHYIGELIDGKMVFIADTIQNGKKAQAKMTFSKLPDGSVRQLGENSADEGKTWAPSFDFTYTKK